MNFAKCALAATLVLAGANAATAAQVVIKVRMDGWGKGLYETSVDGASATMELIAADNNNDGFIDSPEVQEVKFRDNFEEIYPRGSNIGPRPISYSRNEGKLQSSRQFTLDEPNWMGLTSYSSSRHWEESHFRGSFEVYYTSLTLEPFSFAQPDIMRFRTFNGYARIGCDIYPSSNFSPGDFSELDQCSVTDSNTGGNPFGTKLFLDAHGNGDVENYNLDPEYSTWRGRASSYEIFVDGERTFSVVPLPASIALMGAPAAALAGLSLLRRRRRRG